MKQSNWILGIGIIVAIILLISTFLFKPETQAVQNSSIVSSPITALTNSALKFIKKPVKAVSLHLQEVIN